MPTRIKTKEDRFSYNIRSSDLGIAKALEAPKLEADFLANNFPAYDTGCGIKQTTSSSPSAEILPCSHMDDVALQHRSPLISTEALLPLNYGLA